MSQSSLCLFHDEYYLQDKTMRKEHEQTVRDKLMTKVHNSIDQKEALLCIGYYLPDNITIKGDFTKAVHFSKAKLQQIEFSGGASFDLAEFSGDAEFRSAEFSGLADFREAEFSGLAYFTSAKFSNIADFTSAKFSESAYFGSAEFSEKADFYSTQFCGEAEFSSAKFSGEAEFSTSTFKAKAYFNYVLFEDGKKILFGELEDLSQFSFMNTDITRVRFSDRARWGKQDKFKVLEEKMLEDFLFKRSPQQVSLGSVMAVYRNLRENYEFRLRYDEAGKFFIKEMELKRRFREKKNSSGDGSSNYDVVQNCWLRRNFFSLTGLYYHLSRYGEDLLRPTLAGITIVFLSTLFWVAQANPVHEPSLSHIVGFSQVGNHTQWYKSFERSLADLIPFLPSGNNVQIGLLDYAIKIAGGVLTFGLLAIALRRKFERKYTR